MASPVIGALPTLPQRFPPVGLLPFRPPRARPYFYSMFEIQKLLKAAKARPSVDPLRPWTYYCLFGLLAVTGLRLGEALHLQTENMDWSEGILTIKGAKFGKSRLVPLHRSTCDVLADYLKRRDRRFGTRSDGPFLVNKNGNHLDKGEVHRALSGPCPRDRYLLVSDRNSRTTRCGWRQVGKEMGELECVVPLLFPLCCSRSSRCG